ncbi:MAG: 1-acyl-sn-glycerol-3-phosphate acyltransferase [Saprospiraceae bacterium]|nr:1-acyl-sn-glycerol-3-phosphate acyltransferase [Saprospiraceae bacterium]
MLYKILRQITASLFKIYFRKIYLIDADKLPLNGPVVLSCNHPMAFSEACLLACFLDRPLYFLVRGDVFAKGWDWFLQATNQIPIYRFRDGFSNMRRNKESFVRAYEALADNKAILIFSEGNTRLQKKLFPLQKGLSRLAFGAYSERSVKNIQIVPVGVNYSDGKSFRSDVQIKIGDPIPLESYLELYDQDPVEAGKSITDDLYAAMRPLVIHLDEAADEPLANRLFEISGNYSDEPAWPVIDRSQKRFNREKNIANQINHLSDTQKSDLLQLISAAYIRGSQLPWKLYLILILGIPVAIIGFLLNAIPFYLSKRIADGKVRQVEFYTPVRMGLNLIFYLLWLLLGLILFFYLFGWMALVAIWILPLTGFMTILWKEGYHRAKNNYVVKSEVRDRIESLFFQ